MSSSSSNAPALKGPLLDVNRDNAPLRQEILDAITAVFDSGRFLYGPDVKELETSVATMCGTKHAVGCASGSDALLLSLMAFNVGPGDEVIVPSFTFFATASCVWRLGAKIVFVDIERETFNLDVQKVRQAITPRTKAIIPVHLFGQCAAMDEICAIAREHGVRIVEDAAQSIGAAYKQRVAGSWGDVGCFSFYPTKNLGGCGDGGMLTTNDDALVDRLRLLAAHGMHPRYVHTVVGVNSRLDSIQAAALNVKLKRLNEWTAARQENAAAYHELFTESGLGGWIELPQIAADRFHVWNQYTLRVVGGRRDPLRKHLSDVGIGTEIYYPRPLHLQDCFADAGFARGSLPVTEQAADEVLSLPIFPGLTIEQQRSVVQRIGEFFASQQASAA
jgi:dTDP-4-amino-4,6-dideoxygalactose transaminase